MPLSEMARTLCWLYLGANGSLSVASSDGDVTAAIEILDAARVEP